MYPSEKDKEYFFKLLSRYNAGEAAPEEIEFVERYMQILDYRTSDALQDFEQQKANIASDIKTRLLNSIHAIPQPVQHQPVAHRIHFLRHRRWWAAASIAVLMAGGGFFLLRKEPLPPPVATAVVAKDIKPGKAGAILTLSDGTQVVLDSLGNGIVATQGNTEVHQQGQQLVYNKKAGSYNSSVVAYNTMTTPRGRQFQLTLPDGTKVWLNAASSLTYPTVFSGKERKVTITGEAYFEVAEDVNMPFKVAVDDVTAIEVLGTHFNVNAYSDESSIKTTLLEGAVRVTAGQKAQQLRPGQQAQVFVARPGASGNNETAIQLQNNVNVNQAVAWKEGVFSFNNADLMTVMRELARWYDIKVEFQGIVPNSEFSGEIDKSLSLSQVLKGLSKTRINYRIEDNGGKLVILP